jgi:LuxR family maltose regulon positive regulatory protein
MHAPPVAAPLLATKLYLPTPRVTAVVRPRLLARMRAGLRGRLTLIAAPAGFGKSTLLAQALQEAHDSTAEGFGSAHRGEARKDGLSSAVAWVALDPGDNDPARFWSYVCTALERASPGLGASALAVLRAAPSAVEPAATELLNALAAHETHVTLILDDYHVITSAAIHERVSFLLEHAPRQFHLVIASRADPPLPLARWRARSELVELRAADLRFTPDEALQFLAETMGLDLDMEAAAALEARTEGWAAGLQLAALSLQGQTDMAGFIASFSGSHRHVVDYMVEEVLGRQPEHIRSFLLQTAILNRLCGPLCDTVLGIAPPQKASDNYSRLTLDTLERDNLFLIPLDEERRWYRYHHLFGDLLRHRLQQEHPALVAELHRRAAAWFEQQDAPAEAMGHAVSAGDTDLLARLLARYGAQFTARGEMQTLQGWLNALPREQLLQNPRLCLIQAQVLLHHRQVNAAEPYLQAAELALGAAGPEAGGLRGELLTQRAHVAIERGVVAEALSQAREASALLAPADHWARSNNGLLLGYALMVLGQTSEAVAVYVENVRVCRLAGNVVSGIFSANEIIKLRLLEGRLSDARAAAEEALAWVAEEGWGQLPPASALHIWLGNTFIEQGDFTAAAEELALAHRLTQIGITTARAHTFLARLQLLQGNVTGANVALAAVEALCRDWEPGGERMFFDAYVARLRLLGGDLEAARTWAGQRTPWDPAEAPSYFREIELLTLARVAVLAGDGASDLAGTLAMLGALRAAAAAGGRRAVVSEALALEALALERVRATGEAQSRLDEALALVGPAGFVGLFADLGAPMAALLAENLARRGPADPLRPYLTRLLGAFDGKPAPVVPAPPAPVLATAGAGALGAEALTEREREVLRLFVAGMTSPEIAQHFVVSVNTVKTQLKSIYSKLDTHSRAELVARARALNLIP